MRRVEGFFNKMKPFTSWYSLMTPEYTDPAVGSRSIVAVMVWMASLQELILVTNSARLASRAGVDWPGLGTCVTFGPRHPGAARMRAARTNPETTFALSISTIRKIPASKFNRRHEMCQSAGNTARRGAIPQIIPTRERLPNHRIGFRPMGCDVANSRQA